jgi:hypothetical protein
MMSPSRLACPSLHLLSKLANASGSPSLTVKSGLSGIQYRDDRSLQQSDSLSAIHSTIL